MNQWFFGTNHDKSLGEVAHEPREAFDGVEHVIAA